MIRRANQIFREDMSPRKVAMKAYGVRDLSITMKEWSWSLCLLNLVADKGHVFGDAAKQRLKSLSLGTWLDHDRTLAATPSTRNLHCPLLSKFPDLRE